MYLMKRRQQLKMPQDINGFFFFLARGISRTSSHTEYLPFEDYKMPATLFPCPQILSSPFPSLFFFLLLFFLHFFSPVSFGKVRGKKMLSYLADFQREQVDTVRDSGNEKSSIVVIHVLTTAIFTFVKILMPDTRLLQCSQRELSDFGN